MKMGSPFAMPDGCLMAPSCSVSKAPCPFPQLVLEQLTCSKGKPPIVIGSWQYIHVDVGESCVSLVIGRIQKLFTGLSMTVEFELNRPLEELVLDWKIDSNWLPCVCFCLSFWVILMSYRRTSDSPASAETFSLPPTWSGADCKESHSGRTTWNALHSASP